MEPMVEIWHQMVEISVEFCPAVEFPTGPKAPESGVGMMVEPWDLVATFW